MADMREWDEGVLWRILNDRQKSSKILMAEFLGTDPSMLKDKSLSAEFCRDFKNVADLRDKDISPNFYLIENYHCTDLPLDYLAIHNPKKLEKFIEMGGLTTENTFRLVIPKIIKDPKQQVKVAKILLENFNKNTLVMNQYNLERHNGGHVDWHPNGILQPQRVPNSEKHKMVWTPNVRGLYNPMESILKTENGKLIDLCIKHGGDIKGLGQ